MAVNNNDNDNGHPSDSSDFLNYIVKYQGYKFLLYLFFLLLALHHVCVYNNIQFLIIRPAAFSNILYQFFIILFAGLRAYQLFYLF